MSLSRLAERLDDSIGELAPARHGAVARHRTMRAALDWGFDLLSPPAQAALRAMSVFAGGCDLAAFAAVCVDDEHASADDVLDELVRTSFVTVDFASDEPATASSNPSASTPASCSTPAVRPPTGAAATWSTTSTLHAT